jgi:tyrosine-protein kinase Etk/Wzc
VTATRLPWSKKEWEHGSLGPNDGNMVALVQSEVKMPDDEINLLDYWNVIRRRKKVIIALFLASVIVTMVVSLLLPPYYRSESVIIAAGSEAGGLGAALSSSPLAGALVGAAGIQTPADKVMVILKSRTVAEAVIRKFDLLRVFNESDWDPGKGDWKDPAKPPLMQDAVKKLTKGITTFSKSKEGAITVAVEWKDAKLASDMANYYIASLTGLLNEKAINITTQVVDRAVPAERKSRPKIKMNMILAGFASIFAGIFIIFFLEYLEKSKGRGA